MAYYEIPLGSSQRTMTIALGGLIYGLRLTYANAPEGGWVLDLSDAQRRPLLCGVPLVEGADILGQYAYLGMPGSLWLASDANAGPLTYDKLGVTYHLLFEPHS